MPPIFICENNRKSNKVMHCVEIKKNLSGGCEIGTYYGHFSRIYPSNLSIYLQNYVRCRQIERKGKVSKKSPSEDNRIQEIFCLTNPAHILHNLCFLKLHFSCRSKSKVKDVTKKVNSHFISLRFPIKALLLSKSQKCQALATDLPTDGRIQ